MSPVSKPGAPRGSGRGESGFIGWTDTLSISSRNKAPCGEMQVDHLAPDGPEGSGSRPGGLICDWESPLLHGPQQALSPCGLQDDTFTVTSLNTMQSSSISLCTLINVTAKNGTRKSEDLKII